MQATFGTVTKRRNSTKQMTGGTAYDIVLKEGCGVLNPRIALKWNGTTSPTAYNACYIPSFGRYYYVNEWTYEDRQWCASCTVDALATYKTEIGASTKYILRAADQYDLHIIDNKYPVVMPPTVISSLLVGIAWATEFGYGRFVVGIVGQGNTFQSAGAGFVVLTSSELQQLLSACFTETNTLWSSQSTLGNDVGTSLARFGENLMKSVSNPIQFINSVFWVPFVPATSGTTTIHLGSINTGISAATLSTPVTTTNFHATFDTQENGTDDWHNIEPFVHYTLHCPPFPDLKLPADKIVGGTGISGVIYTDVTCGLSHMEVYGKAGAGKSIATASGIVGVNINLSGSSTDYGGIVKSAAMGGIGVAGGLMTGNVAGAIVGGVSAIGNVIGSLFPQATNGGYSGGLAALKSQKYIVRTSYSYPDPDITEQGRPYMKAEALGGHTGFLLCADGDVEIAGTPQEQSEIRGFLTGGFFYE